MCVLCCAVPRLRYCVKFALEFCRLVDSKVARDENSVKIKLMSFFSFARCTIRMLASMICDIVGGTMVQCSTWQQQPHFISNWKSLPFSPLQGSSGVITFPNSMHHTSESILFPGLFYFIPHPSLYSPRPGRSLLPFSAWVAPSGKKS